MYSLRQTAEIIDKFIDLTQTNQIKWASNSPDQSMIGPESRVDMVYVANYIGRNIRVYKEQYKYYLDEDRYTWDERINIEFIDEFGNLLGELPRASNAYQLLSAIQFQNPQINNFYKDLFG